MAPADGRLGGFHGESKANQAGWTFLRCVTSLCFWLGLCRSRPSRVLRSPSTCSGVIQIPGTGTAKSIRERTNVICKRRASFDDTLRRRTATVASVLQKYLGDRASVIVPFVQEFHQKLSISGVGWLYLAFLPHSQAVTTEWAEDQH